MAKQARRTNPGDVANLFIRCLLADAGRMLGGLSDDEWAQTRAYFDDCCAYSGVPLSQETLVRDHAVPTNKTDCGLHLFGNVIPCTAEENRRKGGQHFRDYVSDPARRERIETFLERCGYWEKASALGDVQAFCETQYSMITALCKNNHTYLRRILGDVANQESPEDGLPAAVDPTPAATESKSTLPITLIPADPEEFKRQLMHHKFAWIKTYYAHRPPTIRGWNAARFRETSHVLGNLRSRPEFRQGNWQRDGVVSVVVSISKPTE